MEVLNVSSPVKGIFHGLNELGENVHEGRNTTGKRFIEFTHSDLQQLRQPRSRCFYITFILDSSIYFAVGIANIVVGSIYLNDCPAQKLLPQGLVVLGSFIVMLAFLRLIPCLLIYECSCEIENNEEEQNILVEENNEVDGNNEVEGNNEVDERKENNAKVTGCLLALITVTKKSIALSLFATLFTVCYWTYTITPTTKPEDHDLKNYCDDDFYKTSYYGCIVMILLILLQVLCFCCQACV